VHHDTEVDIPLPDRDETIETREYSDGFGRLLQTRTQAEEVRFGDDTFGGGERVLPSSQNDGVGGDIVGRSNDSTLAPNIVVSGWQIYDNKGRVVEKYEPFFASTWDYAPPTDAQRGQRVKMYYDPRGHVIRTVNPDNSEQLVIYGIPHHLDDPPLSPLDTEKFSLTPWETYTYDANDNAGRTSAAAATDYRHHWNTPTNSVIDALGRTVLTVERNRAKPAHPTEPLPSIEEYRTSSTYDIRGNLLTVTDALGRVAFTHLYDLANRPLRIESIDAGVRRMIVDAAGNTLEQRDSKGALLLHAYDLLHRLIRLWARDGSDQPLTLREQLVYGDSPDAGLTAAQATAANLLGKLYQHYDEAGLLTSAAYDCKGNLLEKRRQVVADSAILEVFNPPPPNWEVKAFRVNWELLDATPLDTTAYTTTLTYDALNRVKTMQYPQDVERTRKTLRPHYNRAGALESVTLDGTTYVERIAYNAKGQRTLITYGNSVMTRYAYDPQTFRLVRMRTEGYSQPAALTYHPTGAPLQDLAYGYDLVGNVLNIQERTPGCGVLNNPDALLYQDTDPALATLLTKGNALIRRFENDPLYRLLSATGRECDVPPPPPPWNDQPRCTDLIRTRGYTEQYNYDPVGNIRELQHTANGGSFTRAFSLSPQSNRLATLTIGATTYDYTYDANGNLTQETASRHCEWDHSDRMRVYRTQVDGVEPSVHAHYLYDAGGQRVKKLVRKQGGQYEVTVYVDGIFEYQRTVQGGTTRENNTLHVMDNQQRITLVRVGTPFPDDTTPAIKYHLGDHLGSSNVVTDNTGAWINREEYTPYGETSFGSFARKRYRFTGKERDEESSLYYHGARYYAPWLARWISCDPMGTVDGTNLYSYAKSNPLRYVDPYGTDSNEVSVWNVPDSEGMVITSEKVTGASPTSSSTPATSKPSVDPDRPAQTAGSSLVSLYNTTRRMSYSAAAKEMSAQAVEKVFAAWEAADLSGAEKAAKEALEARNSLRTATQAKLTPGARLMSEMLEQPRTWELMVEKYGGAGQFETYVDIAAAAGRSRPSVQLLSHFSKVAGPAGVVVGIGVGVKAAHDAPPEERPRVATQEAGSFVGGAVGAEIGTAAGTAIAVGIAGALGLSGPPGWIVLTLGLAGGAAGGYYGSEGGRQGAGSLYDSIGASFNALHEVMSHPQDTALLMSDPNRYIRGAGPYGW
jgi:RHS repeat-associated protein